jgi:hypothetical protein
MVGYSDSLGVELKLNQFKNWNKLINQTEIISCNDSLPKITLRTDNEIKTIYLQNPCWKNFGCILIKQRNIIQIHNDTINKYDDFYPLDSLESVLKRDVENNGKNFDLSDSPEKLLIDISYDKNGIENLPKFLLKLTQTYEKITNNTDINIWLSKRFGDFPIPPPPPGPPEVIEIIEEEI